MRLFGADPEELRVSIRKMYEAQMERDIVQRELDKCHTENGLLRSKVTALELQLNELKRKALELRGPRDPFANLPEDIRNQIDYAALGMEEPDR